MNNQSTFTLYAKGPKGTKHLPNLTVKNLTEAECRAKCNELRELGYRNFDPRKTNSRKHPQKHQSVF